jgi:ABC-type branched-subunit amino acid transport system ATPase component
MALTLTRTKAPESSYRDNAVAARAVDATKVYGKGEAEVRALDGITVDFATSRFTAIMGPSGSGKSTLMHTLAGLDTLTSGSVWIGDTNLGTLREKKLTQLRRDRIGFVFQAFNLIPTLTTASGSTTSSTPLAFGTGFVTARRSFPAASNNESPSHARSRASRTSSSPTNPPATSTPARVPRSSRSCVRPCASSVRRS